MTKCYYLSFQHAGVSIPINAGLSWHLASWLIIQTDPEILGRVTPEFARKRFPIPWLNSNNPSKQPGIKSTI